MLHLSQFNDIANNFMASVDGKSLREEAERIKSEFERITDSKKVDPELSMLFKSMLMLMNLLVAIFLEKTTKKNNKNSSKPSSQTKKDESSPPKIGSNGKGKRENNTIAKNTRTIETTSVSAVTLCDTCGEDLSDTPCQHIERRTKIDIVFEKRVDHIDAEVKQCDTCDSLVKGQFPADMPGPLQYGHGLKAFAINLLVSQMLSLNRAQKLIKSMTGEVIAEATLLKFVLRLHHLLEAWEKQSVERIFQTAAMNVDETSLRVNKRNHWIHVYSADEITLKLLHQSRGKDAIDAINIIPRYTGAIIHDCWQSYFSYENCNHGLCGSHIVRELTAIIESNGYRFASNMKVLLLETCKIVSKRKRKRLSKNQYANLQKRYRNIVTRGESELPPIPPKFNGKRGKIAKSDAHNLLERLKEHEAAVLLFAKLTDVSFTNNRAERDLRMAKVKQKVSGCFRKELYAQAYCRISSYLQTMANKNYNPLIAIQMALEGNALAPEGRE